MSSTGASNGACSPNYLRTACKHPSGLRFRLLATFGDGFKKYVIYRAYLDTLWAARGHALSLLAWPTLATPPLRASGLAHAGELPGSAEIVGPTRSGD